MELVESFLVKYPELALFLAIAVGYYIGGFKIGNFSLGPVTGSLFAGIVLGNFAEVPVSGMTKSFLFLLFLFGIGYSVGPQFLQALKQEGIKPVLLAIVVGATGLLAAFAGATLIGVDSGYAAGLLSGGLTASAAMGTATEAIWSLSLPQEEQQRLVAHIAIADAVCYIFGTAGAIWFCTDMAPRLLGIDLKAEALRLEQELGIKRQAAGVASAWRKFEIRAYEVPSEAPVIGRTIAEMEKAVSHHRLFIERVRRGDALLDAGPDLVIKAGDILAVAGRRELLIELLENKHKEIEDRELLDIPILVVDVFLTNRALAGKQLAEIAAFDWTRSVFLRSVKRGGQELPIGPGLVLHRGDILSVAGPEPSVTRAAEQFGPIIAPTTATDFVVLGLAVFVGGVAGVLVRVTIGETVIALSTSVGTLLAGLLVGHLRTRHPMFGRIPDGAVSLMTSLGLATFVAMTGLHAGPLFLSALAESGIGLLLAGAAVTLLPMTVGLYFGRYVLGMNPIMLLGGLAGAQTVTAAMAAVQTRSGSPVAVLGYTPAYPIGNILLTIWGTVIVVLMAQ